MRLIHFLKGTPNLNAERQGLPTPGVLDDMDQTELAQALAGAVLDAIGEGEGLAVADTA
ncbi:hypothetical protein [Sphingopyxis flava]|uniref:hypothetical protein n=1 Tax=Sphingopyxis flava TaxID=1507287 RepID=UPI00159245AE|nr:hypothetical protein [Sphingopyxis flava]